MSFKKILSLQLQMINLVNILIVALGGALGSTCRYVVTCLLRSNIVALGGIGTFAVNCIGSFLIGLVSGWLIGSSFAESARNVLQLLLVTGVLGGFTTFSAFSFDCVKYISSGQITLAIIYPLLSVILGIILAALGLYFGGKI